MRKLKVGVIGLGKRGSGLMDTILKGIDEIDIVAVSDNYQDRVDDAVKKVVELRGNTPFGSTNYKDVLALSEVEAVIVATSWETHVSVSIDAMRAGKATGMEVGGAYNVEELWELVDVYEETKTPFMFLENCCYGEWELLVTNIVRQGDFGDIVYCSGAYAHDLREEITTGKEKRHYRLNNYINRNGENYPTHELGPIAKILNINRGNKMTKLVSVASRQAGLTDYVRRNPDKIDQSLLDVEFKQGDVVNTIITCEDGSTISLKLDTSLPRFYSREFAVHGTKGLYNELAHTIYFEGENEWNAHQKHCNQDDWREKYAVPIWRNFTEEQRKLGHGGMDFFELKAFAKHVLNNEEIPIDVYDAAAWMVITCLSEKSIKEGCFVEIPDFTRGKYKNRPSQDVVPLK